MAQTIILVKKSCCSSKTCWQVLLLIGILAACFIVVIVHRNSSPQSITSQGSSSHVPQYADFSEIEEDEGVKSHSRPPSKNQKGGTSTPGSSKRTQGISAAAKEPESKSNPSSSDYPAVKNGKVQKYKIGHREVYLEGENRENYPVKTLPPGQVQNFKKLMADCKKSGKDFEDPEFNPNGKRDLIGNVDLLSSNDYPKWNGKFVWKRPKEVNKNVVFSTIDKNGKRYRMADITQGSLGDCYYLSALGLVTSRETLVNFIIPPDNNHDPACGIYHFRFWIRGYYFDIVIDDRLPYIDINGKGKLTLAFTAMGGNEMWPVLMEKAYAKIYGSYSTIEGGVVSEALEDMTGGIVETSILSKGQLNFDSLDPNNAFVGFTGFGTPPKAIKGLVDGHAYALIGKTTITNKKKETIKLARMRNPWGNTEWNGDWSDESPLWNTIDKEQRDKINIVKDEGEFWISQESAADSKVFDRVYTCPWYNDLDAGPEPEPKAWEWYNFHGIWKGKHDIKDWEGLAKKPQFVIQLSNVRNDTNSILVASLFYKNYIERKDKIPSINMRLYEIVDKTLTTQKPPFPAQAFKTGKIKRIQFLANHKIAKTREYSTGAYVPNGFYIIIPYVEPPGEEGGFLLRVIGEKKISYTNPDWHNKPLKFKVNE